MANLRQQSALDVSDQRRIEQIERGKIGGVREIRVCLAPMRRHFIGLAVMFMSDKPEYREHTDQALNPPLEQTYFVKVPRSKRFVVKGSVTMSFALRVVSRRQAVTEQTELLFPVPIELDLRPSDKAIYIGTLRLHRDEFHEVTRAEVRDDFAHANAEFKRKFGTDARLRKALIRAKPKP
jgi:hypothetical protein